MTKTFKVYVDAPGLTPFVNREIVKAASKKEAAKTALARYRKEDQPRIAFGSEPVEVHPANYEPLRRMERMGDTDLDWLKKDGESK